MDTMRATNAMRSAIGSVSPKCIQLLFAETSLLSAVCGVAGSSFLSAVDRGSAWGGVASGDVLGAGAGVAWPGNWAGAWAAMRMRVSRKGMVGASWGREGVRLGNLFPFATPTVFYNLGVFAYNPLAITIGKPMKLGRYDNRRRIPLTMTS
jgi:hypothetical protein